MPANKTGEQWHKIDFVIAEIKMVSFIRAHMYTYRYNVHVYMCLLSPQGVAPEQLLLLLLLFRLQFSAE